MGPRPPGAPTALGFGGLLRRLDAIPGIERIRYTSPHPKDMRDDVIAAHRECAAVCEHVHLPLQSGSTRILKAMRRTYSRERYVALAERLRAEVPGLALTTDIIVGFPGETEDDFRETLEVVEEVGYDHAFTFIYSPRRGTDAGRMEDQVPEDVKHERLERLVERIQAHADARNRALIGHEVEVLVEGTSRTDPGRVRGKTRTQQDGDLPRARRARSVLHRARRGRHVDDAPLRRARRRHRIEPASMRPVVALFGPTASGKTATAVALAERGGGEVVAADAMGLYAGLPILTAQPTAAENARAPHRLVGIWPLDHEGAVGEYAALAHAAIDEIRAQGRLAILTGGSGLYLRAALVDLRLPPRVDPSTRRGLRAALRDAGAGRGARGARAHRPRRRAGDPPERSSSRGTRTRARAQRLEPASRRRSPLERGAARARRRCSRSTGRRTS